MFVRPRPPRKLPVDADPKAIDDPSAPESRAPVESRRRRDPTSLAFFIGGTTEGPPNV